ncbi:hypothetical protein NHX12_023929 [Muraenolepis orangiensis]|uniref:3CxxC-type domain-containing protein n=1 Tax=Muraenolepis orangiensis TaxID=630683 RepID=A0A9Q0EP94_9TELE|nr:hypothetical protein NHX12_023929 [Muraenolepis orangiensis]KAJ3609407.1 hypothetical protein NHX12_023929 [Muraenolepis orangiensis]
MNHFDSMLEEEEELDYGDDWTLGFNYNQTDEVTHEDRKIGWKVYNHCAFGNFLCASCSKCWSSAKVMVLFRYRLRKAAERGRVIMRPFGQACRSCNADGFYRPGFSEEEVEDTLQELFKKIRKNCYGERQDGGQTRPLHDVKKTKPHETELCEACLQGICCQNED